MIECLVAQADGGKIARSGSRRANHPTKSRELSPAIPCNYQVFGVFSVFTPDSWPNTPKIIKGGLFYPLPAAPLSGHRRRTACHISRTYEKDTSLLILLVNLRVFHELISLIAATASIVVKNSRRSYKHPPTKWSVPPPLPSQRLCWLPYPSMPVSTPRTLPSFRLMARTTTVLLPNPTTHPYVLLFSPLDFH